MAHLHLYMNGPTEGGVNGTEISSGDETLPLSLTMDASKAEEKVARLAVRCDSGFLIDGNTTVYFEGTNASKWQIAEDNYDITTSNVLTQAAWGSTLSIAGVSSVNKTFWVKASSSTDENPQNDRSVDIIAEGLVVAAE